MPPPPSAGAPLRDRVMRSLVWLVFSRAGMQTLSFLSTLLVMRLLRPADYGIMALATIWIATLLWIVQLGLGPAIVQFRDLGERELNVCFWLTMGLATLACAALHVAAPAIAGWFASPVLSGVLRVTALSILVQTSRLVPESLLRKELRLDRLSQCEIAGAAATIVTVIGLASAGAGVWALAVGAVVMQVVQTAMTCAFARWWPGLSMGGPQTRALLRFGRATLASGVCWMVYSQADTFVLGKVGGDAAVGLYAMARQLTIVMAEKVSTLVNQIATPLMAALQDDRERLGRSFVRSLRYVAWLTFPMSAGVLLVGDLLVEVALTSKWRAALPILYVFTAYASVESLAILLPPVLNARYRVGWLFRYNLTLMLVMPVGFWLGARAAGGVGVALTWAVLYPAFVAALARWTLREAGATWREVGAELARPLVATVAMAAVTLLARVWMEDLGVAPVVVFAGCILTGIVTYGAGVLLIGGHLRTDLRQILEWFTQRRVVVVEGGS